MRRARRAARAPTSASSNGCRCSSAPGMTAVTGETGAGKTLVVEAIDLLLGGRADPALVRPGADEALVEGRFVAATTRRSCSAGSCPGTGRSRAYVDGRLASVRRAGRAGPAPRRPARPARPPVAAATGRPAGRARPLRPASTSAPLRAAAAERRPRSTPRSPSSAATSGPGPGRSTCCASRSTRSTRPASSDPDEDDRPRGRGGRASPTPWPTRRRPPAPTTP